MRRAASFCLTNIKMLFQCRPRRVGRKTVRRLYRKSALRQKQAASGKKCASKSGRKIKTRAVPKRRAGAGLKRQKRCAGRCGQKLKTGAGRHRAKAAGRCGQKRREPHPKNKRAVYAVRARRVRLFTLCHFTRRKGFFRHVNFPAAARDFHPMSTHPPRGVSLSLIGKPRGGFLRSGRGRATARNGRERYSRKKAPAYKCGRFYAYVNVTYYSPLKGRRAITRARFTATVSWRW